MLNEAVAYAFAPGLTDDGTPDDRLADDVVRMKFSGAKPTEPYQQFYSMAIIIRPVLRQSLRDHETFSTFLQKAIRKWDGDLTLGNQTDGACPTLVGHPGRLLFSPRALGCSTFGRTPDGAP